jgi:hypothetical protein
VQGGHHRECNSTPRTTPRILRDFRDPSLTSLMDEEITVAAAGNVESLGRKLVVAAGMAVLPERGVFMPEYTKPIA